MSDNHKTSSENDASKGLYKSIPAHALEDLNEVRSQAQKLNDALDPELLNAIGFTHFDTVSSQDNRVTVLTSRQEIHLLASQTLVRIKSKEDSRTYLGVVVKGPYAEPDAVPPNSTMAVSVVVQGKKLAYTFDYHGRAEVEILGEEIGNRIVPPRYRPRPKSPVFLLAEDECEDVLGMKGDMKIGLVVGYEGMEARIDAQDKSVLPRHTGIIGTTGGGKSTTVATTIYNAQSQGIATIIFDVEGEYTHIDKPTDHAPMMEALARRGQKPDGVKDLHIHHLDGRTTRNPKHDPQKKHAFSLEFSRLSPYAIAEILELSDAQTERFLRAYDIAKLALAETKVYPTNPMQEREVADLDEFSTGYPKMTIEHIIDVASVHLFAMSKGGKEETRSKSKRRGNSEEPPDHESGENDEIAVRPNLRSSFKNHYQVISRKVFSPDMLKNEISWKTLLGKLYRLLRLKIFDVASQGVDYGSMLHPGRVTVIDLSDMDSPQLNNLVIADILRGLQERQEEKYNANSIVPTLIIIEEAHEFLSATRISKMPVLFENVARIAKRGRKRWLGLVFVTQLPQHLPSEVLGLINNFVIHKISDASVLSRMQKTIGNIDESLWDKVPRLSAGQALVSFSGFARPLMVAIDPAPCKRLLVD